MSSSSVKREAAGGDVTGLPRKLQRVLVDEQALPVSPTVAAGVLPRSSASFSAAARDSAATTKAVAAQSPQKHAQAADLAGVADPVKTLDAIRAQLALSSDPHLQAKLLLEFSHIAIAPGAPTNAAIDFLFSFLQASQQQQQQQPAPSASPSQQQASPPISSSDTGVISRGGGGPIVVGAIVRGLRKLLAVKAAVVEPMIQVDAMGEQLMQCVSVAEDFKLRRDMLHIVLDCLVLTRAHASAEALLRTCVRDHDAAMQALCLDGFLRLHGAGHGFTASATAVLCDQATALLLHSADAAVKTCAARLLAVLADAHPLLLLEHAGSSLLELLPQSTSVPTGTPEPAAPVSLRDRAFYVLCMAASDSVARVRCEVAQSLRALSLASSHVLEHALQKAPISEELGDDARLQTVLMLASGALLDLLEDKCSNVSAEASKTVRVFAETSRLSELILDRAIAAHVDLLPTARSAAAAATLVETLEHLLRQRKRQFGAAFSLTSEEVSYVLSDGESRAGPKAMLAVLAALVQCDMASVWMAQRVVEWALRVAEVLDKRAVDSVNDDNGNDVDDIDDHAQCTRQLLALADAIRSECGASMQLDVQLLDVLQKARRSQPHGGSAKAQVATLLLSRSMGTRLRDDTNGDADTHSSTAAAAGGGGGARSVCSLFKLAGASPSQTSNDNASNALALDVSCLLQPPSADHVVNELKAIQRLRTAAHGSSSVLSVLQLVELLLQLKQQVRHDAPGAASTNGASSYVSMTAMLTPSSSTMVTTTSNNTNSSEQQTLQVVARTATLSTAALHSCRQVVALASRVFVTESALSTRPRADLLQLVLLARVGLVIGELQDKRPTATTVTAASVSDDESAALEWLAQEGAQLQWLRQHDMFWLCTSLVAGHPQQSLHELTRAFERSVHSAWPRALLEGLKTFVPGHTAAAVILEPTSNSRESREIVAQWPFTVRVRASVTHVRDLTRLYIQSVLPNGEAAIHHVSVSSIRVQSPSRCVVDHTLTLTVSPFSDPTSYAVALCIAHPALPGANEMPTPTPTSTQGSSSRQDARATVAVAYTVISDAVHARISHRTNSAIRRG